MHKWEKPRDRWSSVIFYCPKCNAVASSDKESAQAYMYWGNKEFSKVSNNCQDVIDEVNMRESLK